MEHPEKAIPRQLLPLGAAMVLLTGIPAAWGAFQQPVAQAYALSGQQTGWLFSLMLGACGVGSTLGGLMQDRFGPRPAALLGTALLCGGLAGAAVFPAGRALWLELGFSLPVGLGGAFLSPAVLSCVQKWYVDRKGLATGVIGCATGLSGLLLTGLVWLVTRGPARTWGIRGGFLLLAGLLLPVCLAASWALRDPPHSVPAARCRPGEILRRKNYWLLASAVALATPTVQLFGPHLVEMGTQRGLSPGQALGAVLLGSVGSAVGRLVLPLCSDRWGRRKVDLWIYAGLTVGSAALWLAPGWGMLVAYPALCICYAGQAAILPVFASDLFGLDRAGTAYGLVTLGQALGSLGFPLAADALGLEMGRHGLAIGAAAAGFCCIRGMSPRAKSEKTDTDTEKN